MADLPDDVTRLLVALRNEDALDVLALLARAPERTFPASQISTQLTLRRSIDSTLDRLASLNLVEVTVGTTLRFRYRPTTSVLDGSVRRLLDSYERCPSVVREQLTTLELREPEHVANRDSSEGCGDQQQAQRMPKRDSIR